MSNCTDKKNRYDDLNIPVSQQTRDNMVLKIDDIAYIGRMLTLQDACQEVTMKEMENRITNTLSEVLNAFTQNVLGRLDVIQEDISVIKSDVSAIKDDIVEIYKEIADLQKRVALTEKKIAQLEKKLSQK